MRLLPLLSAAILSAPLAASGNTTDATTAAAREIPLDYEQHILPILEDNCYECHGDGADRGGVALDDFADYKTLTSDIDLWHHVWRNLRAQTMPPSDEPQPTPEDAAIVRAWIERDVFKVDCNTPDPGRVTARRLNRTEYKNTVKEIFGVDYDVEEEFPPDDSGYGFDNVGDALSLSPLLLEKYLSAAADIVGEIVHTDGPQIPTHTIWNGNFKDASGNKTDHRLPFAKESALVGKIKITHPGPYSLILQGSVGDASKFTSATATGILKIDGKEISKRTIGWDNERTVTIEGHHDFAPGEYAITFDMHPGSPPADGEDPLFFYFRKVDVHGPTDRSHLEFPSGYDRIFWDGPPPAASDAKGRERYAAKLLNHYGYRLHRRPLDQETLGRLLKLVADTDAKEGKLFEHGIAQALTALLASPSFLFRTEAQPHPDDPTEIVPLDDYALATRLSYFLWSGPPDDELYKLADQGKLRENLPAQVTRMLADQRSDNLVENFAGQWLRTRDIENVAIDPLRVLGADDRSIYRDRQRRQQAYQDFSWKLRNSMGEETERLFSHIIKEDRSLLELINADYSFLNQYLARHYGLPDELTKTLPEKHYEFQKVTFPEDSHRGGILTHGSLLVTTSNPTRTSPVKRGLFILENLLGTPTPPAPPDVPELDEAIAEARHHSKDKKVPTMRELMAEHRSNRACASCHARFDPMGLALENYNALGAWREKAAGQKIDPSGKLATGETFKNVKELQHLITTTRRGDYYRCITEKLLTYALGRGTEYYDLCTIDKIATDLENNGGKFSTLIKGITNSPAFLTRRGNEK